jgi:SAM-dependent methyltransferase
MTVLPATTVLAWDGPQARAYLARMRRADLRPERIVVLVEDPIAKRRARPATVQQPAYLRAAERAQDRSRNFHPRRIRKRHPDLVRAIARPMAGVVEDPMGFYAEMYDRFSYDAFADQVVRVGANSYRDPSVVEALRACGGGTVVFTGGGILPPAVFEVPDIALVHVHTGLLPYVRGADVLLWSTLVRGRPGISAFLMTPGLDDGPVLATREVEPLRVELTAAERPDDDTLYRALFSFVDPVLRADLLVADVLQGGALDRAAGEPQDLDRGITYHFMHPEVRRRALAEVFVGARAAGSATPTGSRIGAPGAYQRYYEKLSSVAPLRFAFDASRAASPLRAVSIRNRQQDYAALASDPQRLALHRALNAELAVQAAEWPSYDYGEGYFYQSSDELGITGLRDTTGRVEAFGLLDLVRDKTVLEIGCNTGFLTAAIAPAAAAVTAFELNPHLIAIARLAAAHLALDNVELLVAAFEDLSGPRTYEVVLSFANHHTYDGNTRQSLEDYFARCHAFTAPDGLLVFESHPPPLEGSGFGGTAAIIDRYFRVDRSEMHEYGTFLDRDRRFLVGVRREEPTG